MPDLDDARRVLDEVFGFEGFRAGQGEVVGRLLEGRSTLAIFPTGAGKSLCYQLPALLFDGLTLVVSPLIALMKDQVDALAARGVAAARLDSTLDAAGSRRVFDDLRGGRLRLLYVAPERLASERFLQALRGLEVALLAVDEAHCISEWGHNFRPEYLKVARVARRLGVGRVLALTATATPGVARDVAAAFEIDEADVVRTGFHRPNLKLMVTPCRAGERLGLLLERLRRRPAGPTIVYVTRQAASEELAGALRDAEFPARAYHAGLDDAERAEVQDAFMASDRMVVVATIAFGMGIDKADIRAIYHANLPKTLENYAQEIGRAGRDGRPAICELLASAEDVTALENFTYGDTPTPEAVAGLLADVLGRGPAFDVSVYELSNEHDARQPVVKTLLTYLELEGVLEATGMSYAEYKFRLTGPVPALDGLGPEHAGAARRLLEHAKPGKTWLTLEIDRAVEALGLAREAIASTLAELEVRGLAEVRPSGVREGYRRAMPEVDAGALAADLTERFRLRERRDLDRIGEVLAYAEGPGCLTLALLAYFGDDLPGDCGHCSRCAGIAAGPIPPVDRREAGPAEAELAARLRAEGHPALATPRQVARFLCGLSSPAATRARLGRDRRFGSLADVPFAEVLRLAGGG